MKKFRIWIKTRILFRLDTWLAFACMIAWFAVLIPVSLVLAAARRLMGRDDKIPTHVVFLSFEGNKVAPTRVRCYHFCDRIKAQGVSAEVFAFWDIYKPLGHFPFPFRRIWEMEKFAYNVITFFRLLSRGRCVIFEQRPNYDFVAALSLKLVNGSTVVMDIDDWILDYKVVGDIRVKHMFDFFALYADTCVVSSRDLEQRLTRHFPQLPVLPTYVDRERFTPGPARKEPVSAEHPYVFSWVGTIFQDFTYDNVIFLMEAFAQASEQAGPEDAAKMRLDIVGGGDFFAKAKEQAETRFADCNIRMQEWMDPADMPEYLRSIDVGLYCLVEPSHFHKSKSPTKIFEYFCTAKPCITTLVGEAPHFVEHGVTGLLAAGVPQYAEAMLELYRDPDRGVVMGAAGRERVDEEYNMDAACARLKEILGAAAQREHGADNVRAMRREPVAADR